MYNNNHPIPEGEFCEEFQDTEKERKVACKHLNAALRKCFKHNLILKLGYSYQNIFPDLLYKKAEICEKEKVLPVAMKKKCGGGCKEEKDHSEFNIDNGKKDGLQSVCRECTAKNHQNRKMRLMAQSNEEIKCQQNISLKS